MKNTEAEISDNLRTPVFGRYWMALKKEFSEIKWWIGPLRSLKKPVVGHAIIIFRNPPEKEKL